MKYKYVLNGGFASSEEGDMKKLSDYAKKGWLFEKISGIFFYKLKKDKPQNIVYTLDYQNDANEEYFSIMKEAGWNPVYSKGTFHIFSANNGTSAIYSDTTTEIEKYAHMKRFVEKGTITTAIIGCILVLLMLLSMKFSKTLFNILHVMEIIDMIAFIFCFIPYISYISRMNELKKYGKLKEKRIMAYSWPITMIAGIYVSVSGVAALFNAKYFIAIIKIIFGIFGIVVSFNYNKRNR